MNLQQLNEELNKVLNDELNESLNIEDIEKLNDMTSTDYENIVKDIIDNEFVPIHSKLFTLTKKFKESNDYTSYDLPKADRALDIMAESTGMIKDILDDKQGNKGLKSKIRKSLGYSN